MLSERAANLKRQAEEARDEYLDVVGASNDDRYIEQLRRKYLRLQEAAKWAERDRR
jgi:hypothetical protein